MSAQGVTLCLKCGKLSAVWRPAQYFCSDCDFIESTKYAVDCLDLELKQKAAYKLIKDFWTSPPFAQQFILQKLETWHFKI